MVSSKVEPPSPNLKRTTLSSQFYCVFRSFGRSGAFRCSGWIIGSLYVLGVAVGAPLSVGQLVLVEFAVFGRVFV